MAFSRKLFDRAPHFQAFARSIRSEAALANFAVKTRDGGTLR
jgi:hypothetical protein